METGINVIQATGIEELKASGFINTENIGFLKTVDTEITESIRKTQTLRPKYLMEISVLKDTRFPTPDSKYWQCILERNIQFQNLCALYFDYKEKHADIKIKTAHINNLINENTELSLAKAEKFRIQIHRLNMQIEFSKKEAQERVRELHDWTELIQQIEPEMKYSKEFQEEHMPETYLIKFAEQNKMIQEFGATDMNGAMNIRGLGKTAARYWREQEQIKLNGGK